MSWSPDERTMMDAPSPAGDGPPTGIGPAMMVTIAVLAAAAAALAVLLATRGNGHHHAKAGTQASVAATVHSSGTHPATTAASPPRTTATTTATTTASTQASTAATTTQPSNVTVPHLSGSLSGALDAVHGAGLAAVVHYVPSSEPFGTVVAQSPSPGATAPANSQVTINVSSGKANTQGTVPNVVGMSIPAALGAVHGAGLRLVMLKRTVSDRSEAGKVVAQTPAPGGSAPKNSQVLVYMGAYRG
ncbi:MAG TPA: PASTA domain-containing protein [Gaiellaceae bacterium]|jgi:serine/threonine-protein kinase